MIVEINIVLLLAAAAYILGGIFVVRIVSIGRHVSVGGKPEVLVPFAQAVYAFAVWWFILAAILFVIVKAKGKAQKESSCI